MFEGAEDGHKIMVSRRQLFNIEHEVQHLERALEEMIDELPSRFRKQLRQLSQEADKISHEFEDIKGLHWNPPSDKPETD